MALSGGGISWVVVGVGGFILVVISGGGGYLSGGGRFIVGSGVCWWVVVGLFWVIVRSGRFLLGGGW